jgi:hypothetical protein
MSPTRKLTSVTIRRLGAALLDDEREIRSRKCARPVTSRSNAIRISPRKRMLGGWVQRRMAAARVSQPAVACEPIHDLGFGHGRGEVERAWTPSVSPTDPRRSTVSNIFQRTQIGG